METLIKVLFMVLEKVRKTHRYWAGFLPKFPVILQP